MRNLTLCLALAALCLGAVACDEDNPVKPEEFAVTIQVNDTDGHPVEGLRVGLVNDHRFFQDGVVTDKARTTIPFNSLLPIGVRMTVEDIEGQLVQVVSEGDFPRGWHHWVWNGRNDHGVHQPSGRYTVHLVARDVDTDDLIFEGRVDMMLSMLDSSRVPAGYTDQEGKLVLKDKRLFPHLYNRSEMIATDENGEPMGELSLTSMMRISLTDTVAEKSMGFKEDIVKGTVLNLVWDPPLATEALDTVPAGPEIFRNTTRTDDPLEPPVVLGPVFPNPFN